VSMTRSELVAALVEAHPHLTVKLAETLLDTIFGGIGLAMADGKRVEIRGFGNFVARSRSSRMGRNPRTGEPVEVLDKAVPFFRVGLDLKERVNAGQKTLKDGPGRKRKSARAVLLAPAESAQKQQPEVSDAA
jgi:integration host factor subunit beta